MPNSPNPLPDAVVIDEDLLLDLTRRYCEPQRHYHTLEHVADMFVMGRDLEITDEQALAIWFHDAVFDVESTTNEADSAALAVEMLRARNYPETSIETVERIVLDSERHIPTIEASALVIDLDLGSLAAKPEIYDRNGVNIRKENERLTDEEYELGLRAFLESFLNKDQIFWTPWGKKREAAARANLQRSLDELTRG